MVTVAYGPHFEKTIRKIRDHELKERVKIQIVKIVNNPSIFLNPCVIAESKRGKCIFPRSGCPICITNGTIPSSFSLSITKMNNNPYYRATVGIHRFFICSKKYYSRSTGVFPPRLRLPDNAILP